MWICLIFVPCSEFDVKTLAVGTESGSCLRAYSGANWKGIAARFAKGWKRDARFTKAGGRAGSGSVIRRA
jgi:hypothetical protein